MCCVMLTHSLGKIVEGAWLGILVVGDGEEVRFPHAASCFVLETALSEHDVFLLCSALLCSSPPSAVIIPWTFLPQRISGPPPCFTTTRRRPPQQPPGLRQRSSPASTYPRRRLLWRWCWRWWKWRCYFWCWRMLNWPCCSGCWKRMWTLCVSRVGLVIAPSEMVVLVCEE